MVPRWRSLVGQRFAKAVGPGYLPLRMPDILQAPLADHHVLSRENSEVRVAQQNNSAESLILSGGSRGAANHGYHHGKRKRKTRRQPETTVSKATLSHKIGRC